MNNVILRHTTTYYLLGIKYTPIRTIYLIDI